MATSSQHKSSKTGRQEPFRKNSLEWSVFALSLVLLLTVIGYLVYHSFSQPPATPDIRLSYTKDPSPHQPNRYRIVIENLGGSTAEDVKIEAKLITAGQPPETAELQVAFSPKKSKREGWVNFSSQPNSGDSVYARVISYKKT